MRNEYEVRKGERKADAGISLLFWKSPRGLPVLSSPSNGRITFNSTFAFISQALRRELDLTLIYLEQKMAIELLLHHSS